MNLKHSPRPWEIVASLTGYAIDMREGLHSKRICITRSNSNQDWANAKAIAAVPGLLEALKCLLENCPKDDCFDFDNAGFAWESEDYRQAKEIAQQAIAKAEGDEI